MTRGTGYLLLPDKVLVSTEFNGSMYPTGFGDRFFDGIANCETSEDFEQFVTQFNKDYFGYSEELTYKLSNTLLYDNASLYFINFNNKYPSRFGSDWIFFKNMTGKDVVFVTAGDDDDNSQTITVAYGQTVRFNYGKQAGEVIGFPKKDRDKELDKQNEQTKYYIVQASHHAPCVYMGSDMLAALSLFLETYDPNKGNQLLITQATQEEVESFVSQAIKQSTKYSADGKWAVEVFRGVYKDKGNDCPPSFEWIL